MLLRDVESTRSVMTTFQLPLAIIGEHTVYFASLVSTDFPNRGYVLTYDLQ